MPKKLNISDLEFVSGGTVMCANSKVLFQLNYKETQNGELKERFWGSFLVEEKSEQEAAAKQWCEDRHYVFVELVSDE